MTRRLLAVLISVTTVILGTAGVALAVPTSLEHTGQGTNDDGTCETVERDNEVPAGQQVWHFVLTGQNEPGDATMEAEFDDGTTVAGLAPESTPGQTAHFFVSTAEGAALVSATAFFDTEQAGANPQFVVSNCFIGGGENGDDGDNGNGEEAENGETPVPVPTDVPAGVTSAGGGVSGLGALLAGVVVLGAAAGVLLRRRLVHGA